MDVVFFLPFLSFNSAHEIEDSLMKVKGKWSKAANYASWLRLVMVMDGLEELEQEEEEEEGDVA